MHATRKGDLPVTLFGTPPNNAPYDPHVTKETNESMREPSGDYMKVSKKRRKNLWSPSMNVPCDEGIDALVRPVY